MFLNNPKVTARQWMRGVNIQQAKEAAQKLKIKGATKNKPKIIIKPYSK